MKRSMFFVALSILALAVIGFGSRLITNPTGMLTSILIFVAIGAVVWLIISRVSTSSPQRKYNKAVKQSKKYHESKTSVKPKTVKKGKVMDYSTSHSRSQANKTNRRRKSDVHLTVIEGKKGKKKNQA